MVDFLDIFAVSQISSKVDALLAAAIKCIFYCDNTSLDSEHSFNIVRDLKSWPSLVDLVSTQQLSIFHKLLNVWMALWLHVEKPASFENLSLRFRLYFPENLGRLFLHLRISLLVMEVSPDPSITNCP